MRTDAALFIYASILSATSQIVSGESQLVPPDFTYENNGAAAWAAKYPTCGMKLQSPIEISPNAAVKMKYPPLVWVDYVEPQRTYVLFNNWQGVQLMFAPGSPDAKIKGGPLSDEYILSHISFKWANELGSEHAINKYFYGMEAQLIHYKKTTFNLTDALKASEGFAIISILFMIDQKNSSMELEPIVSNLKNSIVGGSMQNISGVNALTWLRKYIDQDCNCTKGAYYTYFGSLTTPPCTENVNWIVMANAATIGALQLKEFQKLKGVADAIITENRRPVQLVNNRKLMYKASASDLKISLLLIGIALVISQDALSHKIML